MATLKRDNRLVCYADDDIYEWVIGKAQGRRPSISMVINDMLRGVFLAENVRNGNNMSQPHTDIHSKAPQGLLARFLGR